MSPAGWERYYQLCEEAGYSDQAITVSTEPAPPTGGVGGSCIERIHELDLIRDYGRAYDWTSLVIDGQEIIPAGRAAWLDFVWLSTNNEQQGWVSQWIRSHSKGS